MRQERATRGTSRERYGMWSTGMEIGTTFEFP
jgi:hypothetical protein